MTKYYYACSFANKNKNKYTYASSVKLEEGEFAVVPTPYNHCGFTVVEVHERILKKDLNFDPDKLTEIVCRLKTKPDEDKEYNKHYVCCINGNRNDLTYICSPISLKPGDMVFAEMEKRNILNVLQKNEKEVHGEYKLIQKISFKRYDNKQGLSF